MSYTDEYLKVLEELEKKKKKVDQTVVSSPYAGREAAWSGGGGDEYTNIFGSAMDEHEKRRATRQYVMEREEDIAPLPSSDEGKTDEKKNDKSERDKELDKRQTSKQEQTEREEIKKRISEIDELLGDNQPMLGQFFDGVYWRRLSEFFGGEENPLEQERRELYERLDRLDGKSDDPTWLQGGAFQDGLQAGDITKTILGTVGDTAIGLVQGAGNTLEGISDLILHGVSLGADAVGADGAAQWLKKEANANAVDNLANYLRGDWAEDNSLWGEKGRGVPQAVGQVAGLGWASKALQAAGWGAKAISAFTTGVNFASSTGSGVSEAYNEEAQNEQYAKDALEQLDKMLANKEISQEQYDSAKSEFTTLLENSQITAGEAWGYGAMKGTVDAGTELIFGGLGKGVEALGFSRGLSSLDDVVAKKLSQKISNQYFKNLAEMGVKATAEGAEEYLAELGTAAAKKLSYMSDKELEELFSHEEAMDAFVVGMFASGVMQGGDAYKSAKSGRDFITGLNANEQKVVDKEVEKRIAEQEKDGKKLSGKEKSELYDKVIEDMDKGYISTDTIEEVLGGETYKSYQDTVKKEEALQKEYDALYKMKNSEKSDEQIDRQADLKKQLEELKNTSDRDFLHKKYQSETLELVKGSRLTESYNERARRGQAFQADLTQYDKKQQAVIQKAIDSGILNNTNRTHEFVDMVAKISADKGVSFDFTDNAKLKDSGFAVDGKFVNGYVTKDGITVNIQSAKSLNSVVGHEIAHILEGTELYTELQNAVFEYAKTKGDYQGRYDSLSKLYQTVKGADVNSELTADLVGDYLFTDKDFISNLSTKHRNVFQKIYDEVKYLCKVATAGSKEARELEKVKRAFEEAYRAQGQATKSEGAQYDITALEDGKVYVTASRKVINGTTRADQRREISNFFSDLLQDNPSLDIHTIEGDVLTITKAETAHKARDDYKTVNGQPVAMTDEEFAVKLNVEAHIDEVAEISRKIGQNADGKNHSFAEDGFTYRRAYFEDFDGQYYEITLSIGHNGTVATVYNVGKIKEGIPPSAKIIAVVGSKPLGGKPSDNMVAQKGKNVNRQFSLSDSNGNQLATEQQEYFKNSAVRDENGNLKVMYHGTSQGGHTVFDTYGSNYGLFGAGSYFTDNKDIAQSYTKKGKGNAPQVYESYLNITNPMDMDAEANPAEWQNAFPDASFPESGTNEDFYRAMEDYFEDNEYSRGEAADIAMEALEGMGYDGITHIGGGRVNPGGTNHQVYIAFHPEQIKDIGNQKPTSDPDIRYSLSDSKGRELSEGQSNYFGDSKIRDEDGSLLVMYHGTPNGDFTVFNDGTYFTANKEYADKYQNPSASSLKSGKTASSPKTFEVYLNITKPFDINDPEARSIYINDYIKGGNAVGINPYLSDAEYDKIDSIDWTEGEDLREFLIENGYDYDGLVLDEGAVGGYGEDVEYRGTSYVVFSPEQVKNVDNRNPTSDPDVRFSLSDVVEETSDLIAAHNLTTDNLLKSLELGGLPMPSVAITKADNVHNEYGEISLILRKDAIDPKSNRENKIYSGDAWTPVYPTIEFKPNEKVTNRISDKYYELARKYGYDDVRPMYRYVNDTEDALKRDKGEQGMLNNLYENTDMMQVYLLDTGKGKVDTVQREIRTELSDAEVEQNEFFISELGPDVVDDVMTKGEESPFAHRKKYWETHGEKIKESYKKLLSEEYGLTSEEVENVLAGMKTFDYLKLVRDAYLYRKNGRVTTKTEADNTATREAIRQKAGEGYKEWIDGLFKGLEEKTGIRNNQDYFTPMGNRRSWDALHWENTLENVVRVMRGQGNGENAFFAGHGIWGAAANEYKSIEEVKADSDRLKHLPEEEYEEIRSSLGTRLQDVAERIKDKSMSNPFIATDNALECIVDAVRHSRTAEGIFKNLKQYKQLSVTETDAAEIASLVEDIGKMPTGYFEAKPRRAVGFDEVGVFVIPNNADIKLKQELLNRGFSIAEYDPNVEGDRQKVVNSFEQYKFSLSDVGATQSPHGSYNVYGKDIALEGAQEDIAPVQEDIAPVRKSTENVQESTENVQKNVQIPTNNVQDLFPDDLAPMSEDEGATEERLASLTEADMPPEVETPYYEESPAPEDPFENRDIQEVGNRKVKAYMYENPEVKPYFQEEANIMLGELNDTVKGERIYSEEGGWTGTSRYTSDDIAYLRDSLGYTYAEIEKGLNAIIEDNGAENNAISKRIEFILNDRLAQGYTDFRTGMGIPANQEYINLINEKQITDYSREAWDQFMQTADQYAPPAEDDIGPVVESTPRAEYEAIRPRRAAEPIDDDFAPVGENVEYGDRLVRADRPFGKERKWVGTSTESESVKGKVLPDDLDQTTIHYQPISNKKTLGNANAKLDGMGYEASVQYFNSQFANKKISLDDVALGERLIQEAVKRGDTKTAGELIQNVAILGTELGQKVQALSIIKRLTPEGQLGMLKKVVERGKTKGDKAYEGVELTQEMIDKILAVYGKDGTFDQKKLDAAVEAVKKDIADQMKVTKMDKLNAWRYLSMLGNPKTHIRNLVSNIAMKGTVAVKNAVARTIESVAPISNRTKTWEKASADVQAFAKQTTAEMKDILSDGGKYSEDASIKEKRQIFKNKILNGLYEFNSDMLSKEDWWFSKPAFQSALSEYLTANGIRTAEDIKNNPKAVEKAKLYATEQSQIATFRQYSWLSNKINDIERHNTATQMAVGAVLPFKKTPINIAKTGLNYSPLGFAKTLTYDMSQVKNGKMEASELVDHLAQNITGSALTLVGYMLASSGFLSGGGEDDKEGEYDYQLGEQSYAVNIGGKSYSLSWLSPVAMPMFIGANAYEQLVEGKEWNGDVVVETLAQTLDPLSEMSFLSGLNQVLSSYDSGLEKFAGIGESMVQNYATQFVPTLSSQVATVMDDTKRSTKVAADSDFRFFDETINKLKLKIPGLRETLEPSTDIWGNDVKQTENVMTRAFETFLAPYSVKDNIETEIDTELKDLYSATGDNGLIPTIPDNYVNYKDEKYKMSASDYTAFKKTYGQTAYNLLEDLFDTTTYQNATSEEQADMVGKVYDYARDVAKKELLAKQGVEFTNAKKDNVDYYKEDPIKGAIENDMSVEEYTYSVQYPGKYQFLKANNVSYTQYQSFDDDTKDAYEWAYKNPDKRTMVKAVTGDFVEYRKYASDLYDIRADKDEDGDSISGSAKNKKIAYINNLDLEYGQKIILFKSLYPADDTYNREIVEYLNSRSDISYREMEAILKELGFTVTSDGTIRWD